VTNALAVLLRQIRELWKHLGLNQKITILAGFTVLVAAISCMLYFSSRPSYRLLYAGLTLQDAAAAREKLEDYKIAVELRDSGHAIYVPAGDVYRGRLMLASAGIPKDPSTGFELFEQPKFGLTDFAQKVNYQRALQGELERTINAMDGIASARVLLAMPQERMFGTSAKERKGSASVMLNLRPGFSISQAQVRSVTQIVGSAVPGLTSRDITVTDQTGRLLSQRKDGDEEELTAANDQIETQERVEAILARKAQEMLDTALGAGRSIVKVAATLDFSRIDKRNETFDAEGRVVASETISSQSSSTPGGMGSGIVSVPVNPVGAATDLGLSKSRKEDVTTQYKVPSGVEHIVNNGVRIKNISVSVCLSSAAAARPPEAMRGIENLVASACGLIRSGERTDSIQVVEMAFPKPPEAVPVAWWQRLPMAPESLLKGAGAVALVIVVLLVSRRVFDSLSIQREDIGIPVRNLAMGGESRIAATSNPLAMEPPAGETPMDDVARLAEQNPRAIATWITTVSRNQR
jgi:flagellar M-ring protein FliF